MAILKKLKFLEYIQYTGSPTKDDFITMFSKLNLKITVSQKKKKNAAPFLISVIPRV